MKGIISIIAGGTVIFAAIGIYLASCKYVLRQACNSMEAGNYSRAKFLAKILSFTPLKTGGYEILGEIAQNNAEFAEAVRLFNIALSRDNTLDNSWSGLFECHVCMDNFSEAARVISEAVVLLPDNELIHVYNLLTKKTTGSELSQAELALLVKNGIDLEQQANIKDVLLKICKL